MLEQTMHKSEEIKQIIFSSINELLEEKDSLCDFDEDTKINAQLGFTSLEFARLVAVLESKTNMDPFSERVAISSVRTIGHLINAYSE